MSVWTVSRTLPTFMRLLFILFSVLSLLSSCGLTSRVIFKNIPDVTDHTFMPTAKLKASQKPHQFPEVENVKLPDHSTWAMSKKHRVDQDEMEFFEDSKTISFLVLRNDTIIYENYFNGHDEDSVSQIFSVSKAYTASMISMAVEEGLFTSYNQPVYEILPEFDTPKKRDIKIINLLQMTSGLGYNDYATFLKLLRMYYNKNLEKFVAHTRKKRPAGKKFAYKSVSTLILGMCLEKVTGKTFAQNLEERIWKPLGMEFPAKINLDLDSVSAHAFGGISTVARDMAKFGSLYANHGKWNGEQLLSPDWISACSSRDTTHGSWWGYNRAFWLDTYVSAPEWIKHSYFPEAEPEDWDRADYFAGGFKGQFIYINPDLNIVIVRQGIAPGKVWWSKSLERLAELVALPKATNSTGFLD